MTKSKNGYQLALRLIQPIAGRYSTDYIAEICTKICRHAKTIDRINELNCSIETDERGQKWRNMREATAEKALELHAKKYAELAGFSVKPVFHGDPRGPSVTLMLEEPWQNLHDHPDGVFVPV